ncbi:MAG: hypothetical protein GX270_07205 [Clostridiaceae bacterium]|nr:hypothetical protein [Clostridiaceae bacterium]
MRKSKSFLFLVVILVTLALSKVVLLGVVTRMSLQCGMVTGQIQIGTILHTILEIYPMVIFKV